MEQIKVKPDEIQSLTGLKRRVCSIPDSFTDSFLHLNTFTLISTCSFLLFPAFGAAHTWVPSSESRLRSQSCSEKWKLGTWWQRWRWMIGFNAPLKGPLWPMICHNPPGILIVNTAKLLAGISTGMSAAGTPGLTLDLRVFITNWIFFFLSCQSWTTFRFLTADVSYRRGFQILSLNLTHLSFY